MTIPPDLHKKISEMPPGELYQFALEQYGIIVDPGCLSLDDMRASFFDEYEKLGRGFSHG